MVAAAGQWTSEHLPNAAWSTLVVNRSCVASAQSEEEAKQLQGLKALQGLGKSSDKVYGPLQRTFQVAADALATLVQATASTCVS